MFTYSQTEKIIDQFSALGHMVANGLWSSRIHVSLTSNTAESTCNDPDGHITLTAYKGVPNRPCPIANCHNHAAIVHNKWAFIRSELNFMLTNIVFANRRSDSGAGV